LRSFFNEVLELIRVSIAHMDVTPILDPLNEAQREAV